MLLLAASEATSPAEQSAHARNAHTECSEWLARSCEARARLHALSFMQSFTRVKSQTERISDKRHRMSWIEQERATALPGLACTRRASLRSQATDVKTTNSHCEESDRSPLR